MPISPLDDLRVEDWDEMIDVNIKGRLNHDNDCLKHDYGEPCERDWN
jgi:NADP-dependent 3-hydroxy acid dehydrogenase YdfG